MRSLLKYLVLIYVWGWWPVEKYVILIKLRVVSCRVGREVELLQALLLVQSLITTALNSDEENRHVLEPMDHVVDYGTHPFR